MKFGTNDMLLWKWILPEFKMHVDNIFVYVYTSLLKSCRGDVHFFYLLVKESAGWGENMDLSWPPYALRDQSKAKSWGLPTSPEYLPPVSTSSRAPKSQKLGPLWKIWCFWITAKGFPTPCWHTSQHTLCMLNSSPNLIQSSQRWWTNISASYNPGNKMAVCSNSFLIMTKCWVGHSEISYTSTVHSMDVHMHIPDLQTFIYLDINHLTFSVRAAPRSIPEILGLRVFPAEKKM